MCVLCVLVTQSCLTFCDPMDCSPPGSSVHGILQARILEWAAISFPQGIFLTQGSNLGLLHCTGCFTVWATREAHIYYMKFTILTILNVPSVTISTFALLCNHHHCPSPGLFPVAKLNLYLLNNLPPSLATTLYLRGSDFSRNLK